MNRHYFIRGEYKGAFPASHKPVHNELHPATGKAFFCPVCAEVWGLFPVDRQETYVDHVLCDKHDSSPSRPYPGCLTLPWDAEWNSDLPTELLVREFLMTLA